jgi:hypothetical protein
MTLGRGVMDADGALAVGLLAQGAAVLALDADGVLALLGEGGVVDDEDRLGVGEGVGHEAAIASPGDLLVPIGLVDEVLQALVGVLDAELERQVDACDERLDALAFAVLEQAAEVDQRPVGLAAHGEVVAEGLGVGFEACEDSGVEGGGVGAVHPGE